jgi:hypothetical protein
MRAISRLELPFFVAALLFCVWQGANAGERERQIIVGCFQRGAKNFQTMWQCTGAQIPHTVVQSCLSGGPCMDPDPWDQGASSGAQQLALRCAQQSGRSVDAFAYCAGPKCHFAGEGTGDPGLRGLFQNHTGFRRVRSTPGRYSAERRSKDRCWMRDAIGRRCL